MKRVKNDMFNTREKRKINYDNVALKNYKNQTPEEICIGK